MVLEAFGLTNIGPARQTNEDCFASVEELCLFAVADGMGLSAAGEVVARLAIESIENFVRRSHETTDFSWPYGVEPNRKTLEAFLGFAYEQGVAHRKVTLDEVFPASVQHSLKV